MDLREKLDATIDLMKQVKSEWVATNPENTDLAIYLHFWRDDEVAVAVQTVMERDIGLQAGMVGAMGFSADVVSISFESFHSKLALSPITGGLWQHREMQFVYETHPEAHDRGWVDSCISVALHERGGEYGFASVPYVIAGAEVIWPEGGEISTGDEVTGGGAMFDVLQRMMLMPTLDEKLDPNSDNPVTAMMSSLIDDPEARRFHTDMATYKALEERNLITGIMFGADKGSNRAKWLEERLGAGSKNHFWKEDARVTDLGESTSEESE